MQTKLASGQALRHHPGSRQEYAVELHTEFATLKLIEEHRAELDGLCSRHHVSRLELFGSAVVRKRGQNP